METTGERGVTAFREGLLGVLFKPFQKDEGDGARWGRAWISMDQQRRVRSRAEPTSAGVSP